MQTCFDGFPYVFLLSLWKTKQMMKKLISILLFTTAITFLSCSSDSKQDSLVLNGAWVVERVKFNDEVDDHYSQSDNSWLRIYDDTCYYQCQTVMAPTGKMIVPETVGHYTLVEKGPDDYLYMHEDGTHPLQVINDSTIMIQEKGWQYTWKRTDSYDKERVADIVNIIRADVIEGGEASHYYIFSYAERDLEAKNHLLLFILFVVIVAILNYFYYNYKRRQRVKHELELIEQERQFTPVPVREAMNIVEDDFRQSDFYVSLHNKVANGDRFTDEDWVEIDARIKSVYPRFMSSLENLYSMSGVELQVCQLIKLDFSPSEIANVLCKAKSSISTIRSRLFSKVFGKKGSSEEWDEFIRSL